MQWKSILTIDAPVAVVWRLTTDIANWPAVTPTVTRLDRLDDGPLRVGSRARLEQPGQAPAVWTVTRLDEGREFTWRTSRLGLTMTGSHLLEEVDGRCRNVLTLDLDGFGAGLVGRLVGRRINDTIATENASFQAHAERIGAGGTT